MFIATEDIVKLTKHAKIRMNQRGISNFALNIIQENGRCERAPGGGYKDFLWEQGTSKNCGRVQKGHSVAGQSKRGEHYNRRRSNAYCVQKEKG